MNVAGERSSGLPSPMPMPIAIAIATLAICSADCTCGKEGPGRDRAVAFAVPAVYELREARAAVDGVVVVGKSKDSVRLTATALDARGHERWQSPSASHVMLDATPRGPIVLVDPDGASEDATGPARRVGVLSADSGRIERTFVVDQPRPIWDAWFRDGTSVFVLQQENSGARATLAAIDVEHGKLLWARALGVVTNAGTGPQLAAAPVITADWLYVQCRQPERSDGYEYDLCRFSRVDGMLTKTFPGHVVDFSRAGNTVFVLREGAVDAVSPEGTTLWTRSLPENYRGDRIVANERWLAVMTTFVRTRQDYDDRLLALDAKDGHELWAKWSGQGGGHFTSNLAIAGDRLVFFGNLSPQIRVVDSRGTTVFEAPMTTQLVVSTEVLGSFAEHVRGGPFLSPPFLALAPGERGLQVYRIP